MPAFQAGRMGATPIRRSKPSVVYKARQADVPPFHLNVTSSSEILSRFESDWRGKILMLLFEQYILKDGAGERWIKIERNRDRIGHVPAS